MTNLADVAGKCNVLYQTRIQKERFLDNPEDYDSAKGMVSGFAAPPRAW